MNFDIIEGLSEEDIMQVYENYLLDKNNAYISTCYCGTVTGSVVFGDAAPGWGPPHFHGYCAMQLRDESSCEAWCTSHRFTHLPFYNTCFCPSLGSMSYWDSCKR